VCDFVSALSIAYGSKEISIVHSIECMIATNDGVLNGPLHLV
jgi:hypothetical protein